MRDSTPRSSAVSGQPFDVSLRTRILEPLRMTDTHFFLTPGKKDRLCFSRS